MAAENKSTISIPHDLEAEQAVLGAIIYDNGTINDITSFITPNTFHEESHRHIFRAMLELVELKQPIDEILLGDQLKEQGKLDDVGGYAYLAELVDCVPNSGNVVYYARIIEEHALLRDIIETTSDISRKSRDPQQPIEELLNEAETKLSDIRNRATKKSYTQVKDSLQEAFARLEEISKTKSEITGLPTGYTDLDRITAGLQPSDLIILAARPSMGKGLDLEENILMNDGSFKKNKDLKVGDRIASVDGSENIVTGVNDKGLLDFYRVKFKDGRCIDCDSDHLWTVSSSKWGHKRRTIDVINLKQLIKERVRYKGRIYTEPISGNFGEEFNLGIHPWVLGALLGDGNFTDSCIRFSNPEEYMIKKMNRLYSGKVSKISDKVERCDYRLTFGRKISSELKFLRDMDLIGKKSYDKFVPEIIFKSSKSIREQVLAGLIETDGWVEKKHALMFSSSSERLRDDLARLVRSLGGNAYKSKKSNVFFTYKGEKKEGLPAYKLVMNLTDNSFIESPRILQRFRQRAMPYPKIIDVEYIGKKNSRCISVSHESGLYCAGDYIITHNSALALNIATYVAARTETKGAVLVFSLEMSKIQLTIRMLSSESMIDANKLKTGNLKQEDWDKLARATDRLSVCSMFLNDDQNLTPYEVLSICRKLAREFEHGIALIVLDYLQLMRGDKKTNSREQEVSEISRSLKGMAKELNVPVIALSQLNRDLEKRTDKRPKLSDLRESGSLEQDSDIILFIYRDEAYNEDTEKKGIAEIIIAKHRNGPTGMIELVFTGKYTKFTSLSKFEPPKNYQDTN